MQGLMIDMPLLISSIRQHAAHLHGDNEIVSRRVEGDLHRHTYAACDLRARKLADALARQGIQSGDRIATLAWIVNHAGAKFFAFGSSFLAIIEAIAPHCPNVKGWIAMVDADRHPAASPIADLINYETLLAQGSDDWHWPELDERSAVVLCYTSGTTGNPKDALYSHRSTVLHAYAAALPDAMAASARDSILPVVPMFHVNAWGLPYICPMVGAKLVLPGPALDGKSLYERFESEGVTYSAGVPTVWLGLLRYVASNNLKFSTFARTVIGGSACPPAMIKTFRESYGVAVIHAWEVKIFAKQGHGWFPTASVGCPCGGDRRRAPQVGRTATADRCPQTRGRRDSRGDACVLRGQDRQVVDA